MTEKGTEHKKNMKLVADELLKLLNTSNKNEDNETKQLLSRMLNNLISKGISKNDLDYSIEIINKFLNGEASFSDITKSFVDVLNKKEEQKASEPKLSDTDIENAKQTNNIWQEYLEKQNKSIFEKILDSNKFDNIGDIFTDTPGVNIKIHERPSIDMLKELFLNNRVEDKIKEKDLSPEEQQKIFKTEFVYPKDLYNMLIQKGAFDKKTQDNNVVVGNKENKEKSEIPSEVSFMEKILKDLYDKRILDKKEQDIKVSFENKETILNKEKTETPSEQSLEELLLNDFLLFNKKYENIINSDTKNQNEIIYGLTVSVDSLEKQNELFNRRIDILEKKLSDNKKFTEDKEQKYTIDEIIERLGKLEDKYNKNTICYLNNRLSLLDYENKEINNRLVKLTKENECNNKFIEYIAEKLLIIIKFLDIKVN